MSTKNVVAVLFGLFLLPVAVAHAEGPQPGEPGYVDPNQQYQQQQYQQQPMGDPNQQQYQQQQAPVEEQTSTEQAQQGRGIEYGGYLTVPIFVGPNADGIGLGVGLLGRVGWEFGSGFTAELNIGVQYNGATLVGPGGFVFDGGITNISLGAGLRYSFLNASALVPFVGVGIQANLWGVDYGGGDSYNDSLAFGFNALAGLAYELSADLAIEAGLRWDLTTKDANGLFPAAQSYFSPFIGATLYY
jgi:opacity protein-like surface antigen